MPGILEEINSLFGKSNLYDVLNVANTSSLAEIKKAYYKTSLTVHPDKCEEQERECATKKFQLLAKIYSILSDKNLRAVYDDTGSVDEEESSLSQDRDWYEYWRRCFPKISVGDIEKFSANYRHSEEETRDLIKFYRKHKGDMDKMMGSMMCSGAEDEPRFRGIIGDLLKKGELEEYERFSGEGPAKKKARLAKYKDEEEEASKMLEELKKKNDIENGEDSLRALISKNARSRQGRADSFLSRLEEKYASPAKKSAKQATKNSRRKK